MEQRRTRRFQLQLPLSITRSGAERVAFAGTTKNISSTGVLFTAATKPDASGPIEYVITLRRDGRQSIGLRCIGKVIRIDSPRAEDPPAFDVAATLERYEFVRDK